ncbi:tol-pal system protein YbgF [Methylobacterium platani]|uniref:Cell division coordinator CpoB n=2 Tax=Methylobacterium platani TaxID=427683 RepID=A0A179SJ79_9HYPH|nr:tol-pal system protein YbgF [Methylobacterium platani]KMO18062.1 tol-pal system protein [Methylobacterium platani JCM 14648]OAS27545.1 tol-pal system protein [Methylobacterium platani]
MLRRLLLAPALAVSGLALAAACPAAAQDAAEFVVRLNRLENQSRQMAGQIESLQYENRQLKEQLRKFQEDVEFRFQESKGGQKPAAATPQHKPQKRSDAFDPSQNPDAPGAPQALGAGPQALGAGPQALGSGPQALGATTPSQAARSVAATPSASASLAPPRAAIEDGTPDYGEPVDLRPPSRPAAAAPAPAPRPSASVAATGTGDAKADYESAYAYVLQRQYEQAEMSLRQFIQSHPRDTLVPDATYWLGESYLQRNRTREAAEQFLKVSTDYARSRKAPDAMLKLGASLNALGAREQACATLAELERKFPQASSSVKQGVDREQRRARCAA